MMGTLADSGPPRSRWRRAECGCSQLSWVLPLVSVWEDGGEGLGLGGVLRELCSVGGAVREGCTVGGAVREHHTGRNGEGASHCGRGQRRSEVLCRGSTL